MDAASASPTQRRSALKQGLISNLPIFRQAPRYLVDQIVEHARQLQVRRGTTICSQGKPLPGLFAVGYGVVKLSLGATDREEQVVRLVRDGETFFDAASLLGRDCPLDAVALADSLLFVIPVDTVYRLIDFDPRFARIVVEVLANRALEYLAVLAETRTHNGVQRVASYFESVAEPLQSAGRWIVRLPAAKKVLASQLGMTKESLSRHLRDLSEGGVISVRGREIAILDRGRLSAIARDAGPAAAPPRDPRRLS